MTRSVRMIVLTEAVENARASGDGSPLFGLVREEEKLIQVLSASGTVGPFRQVGRLLREGSEDGLTFTCGSRSCFLKLADGIPRPASVEVISAREEMDTRRRSLLSEAGLEHKTVALFGAGSLGSMIGLSLAQAGVGRFRVVDRDRLDAANLSRHAADLVDLGRSKARVVAELLQRRLASAEALQKDILNLTDDVLDGIVRAADLVVATTDSPACQFVVNEACIRAGTPAVFAGAYERACGGEVLLTQPESGPCLFCVTGFRAGVADVAPAKRSQAYQAADAEQLTAEPGLAADIGYLAAIAAAYALAALDPRGIRAPLAAPGKGFVLVHGGSTPRGIHADLFERPFDLVYARVERDDPCPVCGWVTAAAKEVLA